MSLNEVDHVDEKHLKNSTYHIDATGKLIFIDENGNDIEEVETT